VQLSGGGGVAAGLRGLTRLRASARAPLVALALVSVLSLGARSLLLDEPCQSPCNKATDHTLIFDEAYYVNAARVIAGIRPAPGAHYARAPLGTDPNAEHPQGAKLIMAAAIEIFGDGPFAWRIGSLLMGSIAILGMFALVRAAGGGRWTAAGAATLMACDNLLLVHGRIGTLDIYAVAAMIWGVALYLRGRPVLAGIVLAVATCFKEVAPYSLVVLALLEVARVLLARRDPAAPRSWRLGPAYGRLAATTFVTSGVFVGLLGLMGLIATPYADADAKLITGGPFNEIAHIVSYAASLTSPHGPTGIASYPWWWMIDLKPIVYLRIDPSLPGHELGAIHPVCAFFGMVSPAIMLLALPALVFAVWRLVRGRGRARGGTVEAVGVPAGSVDSSAVGARSVGDRAVGDRSVGAVGARSVGDRQLAILGVAWFLGTWGPFALQALIDQRTSYLYYMVVVMPGIYVAVAQLVGLGWRRGQTWLSGTIAVWWLCVLAAVVLMYPFVAAF
ncbi:MAG: glycosyltransferase family 39 protein, partial [Solirubrobacteraceae bacterium]